MADEYIFTMLGLNKHYGQKQVLNNINLCFYPGAKIGIVGENGSGKSTVLKIMAGIEEDYKGQAELSKGYTRGIVLQEPVLDPELTVKETIESAFAETVAMLREYDEVTAKMGEPLDDDEMQKVMDRMGVLADKLEAADAWNLDQHIGRASDALCLPNDDQKVGTLSGGERRRVALCKALLEKPDLLLLDEPTNHLDAETIDWLELQLKEYPGTVIIVTHDRYFLDNVTQWILELDKGKGIPFEGNYSSWLEQKLARLIAEEKKESSRARALEHELSWIRMNNKDRQEISRSRLSEYEQLLARESSAAKDDSSAITIAPGPPLGDQVIGLKGLSKSYDGRPLIKDLDFIVPKGAVIGVLGPNGTGKTTLMKMLLGLEAPDSGEAVVGATVKFAYVDQERAFLESDRSLIEEVGGGSEEVSIGKQKVPIRQYLARFGFKGGDQQKKAGQLSGGERNRCSLAKLLKEGGNVLILDEPTNDLDVNTLRLLEEAILNFAGCALVVSHDRFFLDRICTHLLVFEGEGMVRPFSGNYREYEDWRIRELGSKPFENRRRKYKRLPG